MDSHKRDLSTWRRAYGMADPISVRTPPLSQTIQPVVIVDDASSLAAPFLQPTFGAYVTVAATASKQSLVELAPAKEGALVRIGNTHLSTGLKIGVRNDLGTLIDDTLATVPTAIRIGTQRARFEKGFQDTTDLDTLFGVSVAGVNLESDLWPHFEVFVPGGYVLYAYVGIDNVGITANIQWIEVPGPIQNA